MNSLHSSRLEPVVRPARLGLRYSVVGAVAGATVLMSAVAIGGAVAPDQETDPADLSSVTVLASDDDGAGESSDNGDDVAQESLPPVNFELFLARDPFEPVVPEPEPDPTPDPLDPSDPSDPSDPAAPGTPGTPVQPGDPADPDNGVAPGGSCTSGQEVVCDGRVFSVIEVGEENGEPFAVLQVDTMRYRVVAGDVILDGYEIVSVSPDEVRILIGDRVIRVLVGDNALK